MLIWSWLGVCLVSNQSCCSVILVRVWCFFRVVIGSIGLFTYFWFRFLGVMLRYAKAYLDLFGFLLVLLSVCFRDVYVGRLV